MRPWQICLAMSAIALTSNVALTLGEEPARTVGEALRESFAGLELALAPEANPPSDSTTNKSESQPKKPAGKRITLPNWAPADKQAAWDDHFRRNKVTEADVRETVRALMAEKKPQEVIDLVQGAIRHRQAQPWMYEALGIAMQMAGRPAIEIERVMMSAIDFSGSAVDQVRVAQYLSHWMADDRDLAQRALTLYRQAAEQAPTEAEIFVHSLKLAQRWDDVDAIEWSVQGILQHPWPQSQKKIPEHAEQVAKATIQKLLDKTEVDRAAKFQRTVDEAKVRDLVVRVSWIGSADLDLLVEDPAGSIASFRNPRSSGGGVLLRDAQTSTDQRDDTTKYEEFVCTRGVDGNYRMQVRRVWGKVNGDKISIDYWVHRGSPREMRQRKIVTLANDEASAWFELRFGRREFPEEDPRLNEIVNQQLAIGHAILAQQLGGAGQIRGLESLPSRGVSRSPFLRGQVGYQPIIITLPTGANMSAIAVVSNDRRYVRITSQPLFSSIPTVNTFNYATGSSGTSGGGTSGGATGFGPGPGPGGGVTGGGPGPGPGGVNCGTPPNGCPTMPPIVDELVVLIAPWHCWLNIAGVPASNGQGVATVRNGAPNLPFQNDFLQLTGSQQPSRRVGTGGGGVDELAFDGNNDVMISQVALPSDAINVTGTSNDTHFFMLGTPGPRSPGYSVIADNSAARPDLNGGFTVLTDDRRTALGPTNALTMQAGSTASTTTGFNPVGYFSFGRDQSYPNSPVGGIIFDMSPTNGNQAPPLTRFFRNNNAYDTVAPFAPIPNPPPGYYIQFDRLNGLNIYGDSPTIPVGPSGPFYQPGVLRMSIGAAINSAGALLAGTAGAHRISVILVYTRHLTDAEAQSVADWLNCIGRRY